ncbi:MULTISPECIES: MalY/PatB family protein [Romboutsia]|jgi:cystathionine beta-lyase|uniref:MalY/PatB family protein n=1 Tax=Romboutsia TaxID=1501226 RepID=UPI0021731CA1|nr:MULTISPECIES: MalY/PatB family protein [Romboutsia]MCI9060952.1 pyridoxal phosphate-dependent aminotransferase [Romboutsia sp.]
MKFNFDKIIDRSNNFSAKWSEMDKIFGTNALLPMWVADMDFLTAPCIMDALKDRLEQGIFGYTTRPYSYNESIVNWLDNRFSWKIKQEWLMFSPAVITSISLLIQNLTQKNDKIMIQEPVYSPFHNIVESNERDLVISPLVKLDDGSYVMDYEDIEAKIKDVKIFILCNPHNPVGRVWTREELTRLGEICLKHNVLVISDEIHSDIILKNHKHTPFASISKEIEENTITCMAPTKTFNLAGLQSSFLVIPNSSHYEVMDKAFSRLDIKRNNAFSLVATEAAYNYGEDWLDELLKYIEDNIDFAIEYIKTNIPQLKVKKPEGTYLLWVDFNNLNVDEKDLKNALISKGRVALSDGSSFGIGGDGYYRINLACPRSMVLECLKRIEFAINSL